MTLSDEKTEYSNFEVLKYTCNKPYNEIPRGVLMCQNGNWNGTFDCKSESPQNLAFIFNYPAANLSRSMMIQSQMWIVGADCIIEYFANKCT